MIRASLSISPAISGPNQRSERCHWSLPATKTPSARAVSVWSQTRRCRAETSQTRYLPLKLMCHTCIFSGLSWCLESVSHQSWASHSWCTAFEEIKSHFSWISDRLWSWENRQQFRISTSTMYAGDCQVSCPLHSSCSHTLIMAWYQNESIPEVGRRDQNIRHMICLMFITYSFRNMRRHSLWLTDVSPRFLLQLDYRSSARLPIIHVSSWTHHLDYLSHRHCSGSSLESRFPKVLQRLLQQRLDEFWGPGLWHTGAPVNTQGRTRRVWHGSAPCCGHFRSIVFLGVVW